MNRTTFINQFATLPILTTETFRRSSEAFQIEPRTLESFIYKAVKHGELISLKRGSHITASVFEANRTKPDYIFYLANTLLQPSYISLESALQFYGLIPEAINFTYTSVTLQLPRKFQNRLGVFTYRKIAKDLFSGFYYPKETFDFAIAYPHKAIFDYLYYHTNRFTKNMHADILEDLRIDTDELSTLEKDKLVELLAKYTSLKIHL